MSKNDDVLVLDTPSGDQLTAAPGKSGGYWPSRRGERIIAHVSITEEQAVSSYNADVTCIFDLRLSDAEKLHNWLGRAITDARKPKE